MEGLTNNILGSGSEQVCFWPKLIHSELSLWIPVFIAALWTWKTQEINRQTGRSKFTRVQVETEPLYSGGHHNRKGWTDRRGGGSGQGRGRRLRCKLSMDNTEGNARLARAHALTHTLTHIPYAHTYVHRQQMVGQAERLWRKAGKLKDKFQ